MASDHGPPYTGDDLLLNNTFPNTENNFQGGYGQGLYQDNLNWNDQQSIWQPHQQPHQQPSSTEGQYSHTVPYSSGFLPHDPNQFSDPTLSGSPFSHVDAAVDPSLYGSSTGYALQAAQGGHFETYQQPSYQHPSVLDDSNDLTAFQSNGSSNVYPNHATVGQLQSQQPRTSSPFAQHDARCSPSLSHGSPAQKTASLSQLPPTFKKDGSLTASQALSHGSPYQNHLSIAQGPSRAFTPSQLSGAGSQATPPPGSSNVRIQQQNPVPSMTSTNLRTIAPQMTNPQQYAMIMPSGSSLSPSVTPNQQFTGAQVAPGRTTLGAEGEISAAVSDKSQETLAPFVRVPKSHQVGKQFSKDRKQFSIIDKIDLPQDRKVEKIMKFADILTGTVKLSWSKGVIKSDSLKKERFSYAEAAKIKGSSVDALKSATVASKSPIEKAKKGAKPIGQIAASESEDAESSEQSDESSDDSEPESVEEMEVSPLPGQRPKEPLEAIKYDTIKALWKPKRQPLTGAEVRGCLGMYWVVISAIRDRWKKDKGDYDAAATDALKASIKSKVDFQRNQLEVAFKAAQEHGHPQIISRFGTDASFLTLFLSFMADRVNQNDYAGGLLKAALELLARSPSISREVTTGKGTGKTWDKVMARIEKKGDEQTKKLAQSILEVARKSKLSVGSPTMANNDGVNALTPSNPPVSTKPATIVRAAPSVAGVKRSLDSDSAKHVQGTPFASGASKMSTVTKGVGVQASGVGPSKVVKHGPGSVSASLSGPKQAGNMSMLSGRAAATKSGVIPVKRSAAVLSGKDGEPGSSKLANAVKAKAMAKAPNLFTSLSSASKKPSALATPAATAKDRERDTFVAKVPEKPAGPSKPAFSFRDTMEELTREKVVEKPAKKEPEGPPETPEEKAKRMRKESRRHLRVSWPVDEMLVAVREFKSDPSERSLDTNMDVDLNDMRSEGQVLKRHVDVDEEVAMAEALDLPKEEDIREWTTPSNIDYSVLPKEAAEKNTTIYGGKTPIVSPDDEEQNHRESTTLLVHYLDPSDIPPTPREPRKQDAGENVKEPASMQLPDWVVNREVERGYLPPSELMPEAPDHHEASRRHWFESRSRQTYVSTEYQKQQAQQERDREQQSKQQEQQQQASLEEVFARFAAPNSSSSAAPQDPTPAPAVDLNSLLADLRNHGYISTEASVAPSYDQSHYSNAQATSGSAPTATGAATTGGVNSAEVSALLEQLKASTPTGPQQQQDAQAQNPWAQGYSAQYQQQYYSANPYYQTNYNQPPAHEEESRRRPREPEMDDGMGNPARKKFKPAGNPAKKFTQSCRFFAEGRCLKGSECTYRHDQV
ncbi:hypothetical protein P152DRAFT_290512 [Eremomyces bilateralis CBS 781.70]|uniref:C3H1-type domain-containing protein n=1 Tax=Eremomyces bilateralis CBS 781.70 TaxID=1392243 RepID=A0A6G1G6N3_9PEZI|nr:uncharacterized protein P152DRAFT_290512 [Eremomyces bilateralis CBS 781.70]KAF1813745.1 hypothetical protein P152DRAFT_290512 [Eremomyces bilateralis CBS 781.70]